METHVRSLENELASTVRRDQVDVFWQDKIEKAFQRQNKELTDGLLEKTRNELKSLSADVLKVRKMLERKSPMVPAPIPLVSFSQHLGNSINHYGHDHLVLFHRTKRGGRTYLRLV